MVEFSVLRALSRSWFEVRRVRERLDERLKEVSHPALQACREALLLEEKRLLQTFKNLTRGHPVWRWVKAVRGLGEAAAVSFLGEINPDECSSAGKGGAPTTLCELHKPGS